MLQEPSSASLEASLPHHCQCEAVHVKLELSMFPHELFAAAVQALSHCVRVQKRSV